MGIELTEIKAYNVVIRWLQNSSPLMPTKANKETTMKYCTVAECECIHLSKGLCSKHYYRLKRHGTLIDPLKTHGLSRTSTYLSWRSMLQRCTNPEDKSYERYGKQGITVCERWLDSFENFYADMGQRPDGLTLDRKDGYGNYEPSNCRWATGSMQSINRRLFVNNKTGYKNVSFRKDIAKYRVKVVRDGTLHSLGNFLTVQEAVSARDRFLIAAA